MCGDNVTDQPNQAARRQWMGVLASAPAERLAEAMNQLAPPPHTVIRAPETGLVMARARAGGTGQRFNLGEMTVTRCTIRLDDGTMGHAYIAGRDHRKAELAALLDAMLQTPASHDTLQQQLIQPLIRDAAIARQHAARKAAATRVEFFTMARGSER